MSTALHIEGAPVLKAPSRELVKPWPQVNEIAPLQTLFTGPPSCVTCTVAVWPPAAIVTVALREFVLKLLSASIKNVPSPLPDSFTKDSQLTCSVAVQLTLLLTKISSPGNVLPSADICKTVGSTAKKDVIPAWLIWTVAVCPLPVTVTVALLELAPVFGLHTIVKDPLLDPDGLISDSQLAASVAVQVTLLVTETT